MDKAAAGTNDPTAAFIGERRDVSMRDRHGGRRAGVALVSMDRRRELLLAAPHQAAFPGFLRTCAVVCEREKAIPLGVMVM